VFSSELSKLQPSVLFVDQLSAGIPLLRLLVPKARVLFYCHFPDKLLVKKGGILKSAYRVPFDWLESWSTGCSDGIVVNSKYTKSIFAQAFPRLKDRDPKVMYPCVDTSTPKGDAPTLEGDEPLWKGESLLLSINRFEKKKDVGLAIRAYAKLGEKEKRASRLIIAGGYDHRITENLDYHNELCYLSSWLGLKHATAKTIVTALAIPSDVRVIFLLSVPNSVKAKLLSSAKLLIYTPRNEHLGIVPLEGMLAGIPVLAANEGGPTETVVDGRTGWLRDVAEVDQWTAVMRNVLNGTVDQDMLQKMGYQGKQRVKELFSKEKMAARLDEEIKALATVRRREMTGLKVAGLTAFVIVTVVSSLIVRTWGTRT